MVRRRFLVIVEGRTRGFLPFGFVDCGYAVLNGIFLWLALKNRNDSRAVGGGEPALVAR
jgi:hypothetical protein